MVVLNTTVVIYCWPHVDFMALFVFSVAGNLRSECHPSIIRVRSGGGETRFTIGEVFVLPNCQINKNKTNSFCVVQQIFTV